MSRPKCAECGKALDADEIEYYGNSCNECEAEFSRRMSEQMTRPCKFLEAEGDPELHLKLLWDERCSDTPLQL